MDIVLAFIALIGGLSAAYCTNRLIRWVLWRKKGVNIDIDIDEELHERISVIAEYTNLSVEKVTEVLVVKELLKIIDKENIYNDKTS